MVDRQSQRDLTLKGHEVTLLKTSNGIHNEHFNTILNNGYKISLIRNGVQKATEVKINYHRL